MTKLKIYLVRHGQNEDNAKGILNGHRDRPLTELGISQAHQLADHIKEAGLTFDAVYTSPLVRASRTAEIITERLGLLPARESPILIERDFGSMTGKYTRDIEALCGSDRIIKTKGVTYFLDPEGAETFPQLMERARRILEYLEMTHGTGSLLLVCHGDVGNVTTPECSRRNSTELINLRFQAPPRGVFNCLGFWYTAIHI